VNSAASRYIVKRCSIQTLTLIFRQLVWRGVRDVVEYHVISGWLFTLEWKQFDIGQYLAELRQQVSISIVRFDAVRTVSRFIRNQKAN